MIMADMKLKKYESLVVNYILKSKGHFLIATHDSTFVQVLKSTVNKHLALKEECVNSIYDEDTIIKSIKEILVKKKEIVLFLERVFNGRETNFLVKQIKNAYPSVKIVVLTEETDQQHLVLLHEIGADNFINKPISVNTLIEKIAFTIKPPGKIGKLVEAGKKSVEQGSFEQALKIARQLLEVKPNSAAAFIIIGDSYKALGKPEKAVEAYKAAMESAPLYLEPLKKLAQLYNEMGDLEEQLNLLEKLDQLSPLNVDRKIDMGDIHINLGNDEKADQLFSQAVKQAKKDAMTYIEEVATKIGNIYARKDPEKAEKYFKQALEVKEGMLDEKDIKTFILLGLAMRKQGRWEDAIEEYKKAFKINPKDERLNYNIAIAYAEGKIFEKAKEFVERALEASPDFYKNDPVVSYNIGLVYSKNRAVKEAKQYLNYALELNPDFESPKKLLASMS